MIDSSRSVRPFEFETMRQFLVGLLRNLDVGLNATRVGVIQYSSQVQSVFPLGAFSRREDMERAIRAVVPLAQGTMTGLAIQYAMNVAFSEAEGARPSEERVPRVLVIVTDGRPQDRVAEVAAQARARGIEIYAVGVQRADVGSLRAMASPPLDQHVFLVESFDLIQEFGLQFQGRLCGELEHWENSGYIQVCIITDNPSQWGGPPALLRPPGTVGCSCMQRSASQFRLGPTTPCSQLCWIRDLLCPLRHTLNV